MRLRGGRGSPPASPFSKRPRQSATDPPPPPPHLPWTEVGELRDGDVMSYRTEEDDAPWHEGVARSNATTGMVTVKHTGSSSTLAVTTLSDWNSGNYNVDGTATLTSSWTISHALSSSMPWTISHALSSSMPDSTRLVMYCRRRWHVHSYKCMYTHVCVFNDLSFC